jgi:sugar phosphate permease
MARPHAIATPASSPAAGIQPTHVRYAVLGMTVAAYMITYMDRVVVSSSAPSMQHELGLSMVTMGWIMASFRWGYSLFQIPGGWFGDKVGPRRALSLIVWWWSAFTCITALCWNAASLVTCRFLFGMGEAGAFPIATRSLSRWMLPSERGMAQGVTHAGSRLGAALTPPLVVWLIIEYGWRTPFFVFGAVGVLWAAAWFLWYRDTPEEHRGANQAEKDLIHESMGGARTARTHSIPWKQLLSSECLWYVSIMYFFYGYCLAVYLDWFPTYLKDHRGFNLKQMGFYASLPLLAGVLGDLAGGWLSDLILRKTGNIKMARRSVAMGGFFLAAGGIIPATLTHDPVACVWFSCFAVFGLELTVGVSWALPLDIAADYAGSASALMNMCGNIGGAISPTMLAYLVRDYGWNVPFFAASAVCVVAGLLFLKIDASRRIFSESAL